MVLPFGTEVFPKELQNKIAGFEEERIGSGDDDELHEFERLENVGDDGVVLATCEAAKWFSEEEVSDDVKCSEVEVG